MLLAAAVLLGGAVVALFVVAERRGGSDVAPERPPAGEALTQHPALPECGVVEGPALDSLVPGAQRLAADSDEQAGWDVRECRWSSSALGYGEQAGFVAVLFVRNEDDPAVGLTGAEIAAADLAADAEDHGAEPLEGIGDEAAVWDNDEEGVGCVGSVTANLYTVLCYDAQDASGEWGRLPSGEARAGAEELAAYVVPRVEIGEYGRPRTGRPARLRPCA